MDHVGDVFLDTTTPLIALIEAAKSRDRTATEEAAKEFQLHAEKLIDVLFDFTCRILNRYTLKSI